MILGPGAHEPSASTGGARVTSEERAKRLGHQAALVLVTGGDPTAQEELGRVLERRLWDDGYTAHCLPARDVAALAVSQRLGLITIAVLQADEDPSAVAAAAGAERVVVAAPGTSTEGIVGELRARGAFS
jgi:bifunctional enzyme CysN/CysC